MKPVTTPALFERLLVLLSSKNPGKHGESTGRITYLIPLNFRAPLIFAHQGRAKIEGGKFAHQGCAEIRGARKVFLGARKLKGARKLEGRERFFWVREN